MNQFFKTGEIEVIICILINLWNNLLKIGIWKVNTGMPGGFRFFNIGDPATKGEVQCYAIGQLLSANLKVGTAGIELRL